MRVASLYLPNLPTDRLRRIKGSARAAPPEHVSFRAAPSEPGELQSGDRIEDCSCPRGGGWRPGARWAREETGGDEWLERRIARKASQKAALLERLETLPLHQRPPIRELGRRSEPMPNPFRPMVSKESQGAADAPTGGASYDLDGAFWQQGRSLGGAVARAVGTGKAADVPAAAPGRSNDDPPMVTARRERQQMVVAAACPAAQALGLASGMPLTQARAMVPGLSIRPEDPSGEAADLDRLARHAARHWTPLVTAIPGEGLWMEIGASAHLFGGEEAFARRVLALCRRLGLAARIAIADTAAAAHAVAKCAPEPLTVCPSGEEAQALVALPLSALRIDPAVAALARRLGIDTAGALAEIPRAPLVRRFGKALVARLDEAIGARGQPLGLMVPEGLPSSSRRFAEPILTAGPIGEALAGLVRELATALAEKGLGARAIALTVTRIDGVHQRVAIGFARASRDTGHILRLLSPKIEEIEPGFGIERMQLVAERSDPLAPQPVDSALLVREKEADVAALIDRLANRLGWRRLFRVTAVESDVPERSVRRVHALGQTAAWPPWPRPARLLAYPEPVEKVIAELPDQPPLRFSWRGRMHKVVRADGPERIYGEWWRRTGEADAVRDYFQVEDEEGARFWLYRRGDGLDARTGDLSWWIQGLFA